MFHNSVAGALKNRFVVLILAALVGGLGIFSYTQMTIDAYPDISGVQVSVITPFPGRAAEEVEQQITIPLERVMASVPKSEVVRSRTIFGLSVVQIVFEPNVNDYWARNVVFEKIGEAGLPSDAQPTLGSLSSAFGEIYRYELVSEQGHTPMELRTLNNWVVIPRLLRAKGVVEVGNFGGLGKQYSIRLSPERMMKYGVKLQDIISGIKSNNSSSGGSLLERGSSSLVIRGLGRVREPEEIKDIFIKNSNGTPVFVRDVGDLELDHLPQTGIFGKDDHKDGIEGIVRMRRGENPSVVLERVREAVNDLYETKLPKGVKIQAFYDRTELVQETLRTVLHNTLVGIALVVVTLFIFLRDARIAFIVALTIPGSLLFSLILMYLTGIPISLLSVGAIDFGIIVDGAIIVSENIIRHLAIQKKTKTERGLIETILHASQQVQKPMLFSMLIVIIAYVPLLSLRYIEGLLFRPMAVTLCFAFLGALLIALYLIPVLASLIFRADPKPVQEHLFEKLSLTYEKILPSILHHRKKVVGSIVAVFLLVLVFVVPRLGTEFLPYIDEGNFWIRANFPEGISLKENAHFSSELRAIIGEFKEVSFVTSQIGRNDLGSDPFPTNRTELMVGLKPMREWKDFSSKLRLEAAMRKRLQEEFPTTRFNLTQPIIDSVLEDMNGTSADLAVEIVGPDMKVLRDFADQTVNMVKSIPGSRNVNIEQEGPQPQLQIHLDRKRLARYQLSADTLNDVVNTAVGGQPVSQVFEGDRRFDILVKYQKNQVHSPQAIGLLPVFSDVGEAVPLAQVADIQVKDGQTLIARADGQRRMTVRSDIRNRSQGDFVTEAQKRFSAEIHLPAGYTVEWKGMLENLDRARTHFSFLIPLTVVSIFSLLFVTFGCLRLAGLVLTTIPFAVVGGALALWARGMHLSVSAGVGFTSLFGVAAMHGVLMVSYIRQLQVQGLPLEEAILKGASLRFRPILMTAIVAILGLLPASLATGIGSDVQRPIATVIVWGLFFSAALTLFVLPAFYRMLEPGKRERPSQVEPARVS